MELKSFFFNNSHEKLDIIDRIFLNRLITHNYTSQIKESALDNKKNKTFLLIIIFIDKNQIDGYFLQMYFQ